MRTDGYAPIEDYALIGDGRTAALVSRDGSIDWMCLPNLDSQSVFAAILDSDRGGRFELHPSIPFQSSRRYLPHTNVLETIFHTDRGSVRTVDAMTLPGRSLAPMRELVRVVDGLSGSVPMQCRFEPRFAYGAALPRREMRGHIPVASYRAEAIALVAWEAGGPAWRGDAVEASFEVRQGERSHLAMITASGEPLVIPGKTAVDARLSETIAFWQAWTSARDYDGPWMEMVLRSALVLKLLILAQSGAAVAAPTTSLPEEVGGQRNWDYRFCWIRDAFFMISALLELGCYEEARSLFWWFLQATALTAPELHVLYRLDGGIAPREREVALAGYRGSRPVRLGNAAAEQTQLDVYGDMMEAASRYSDGHHAVDADTGAVFAQIADHVCDIWRLPDDGIWEVRNGPFHFTHSKVMCWVTLDRAVKLAERGEMPSRDVPRWKEEAGAIRRFVEEQCWSAKKNSYTRTSGTEEVDASLLMLSHVDFVDPRGPQMRGTIDAVVRELSHGDFVYRYLARDGLPGREGCFLNCSFWLVAALARAGRLDEANDLMARLAARSNDVGLYSEEVDPSSGAFLGNFPQALVHLALIDAACAIRDASRP
jgi:GH15 family glucan-1,4-alpha-glucosidase